MPEHSPSDTRSSVSDLVLDIGSATDVGRVREANEDAYLVLRPEGPTQERGAWIALVAVADGMGGHQAGEVASALAVEGLQSAFVRPEVSAATDAELGLKGAVERANSMIWRAGAADAEKEGMGTTLVAALVRSDGEVVIANVGDSRAYALTGERAALVTADHTWVNQQVQAGQMSEREARSSPFRNLLTRSLGTSPEVETDLFELRLEVGQALILVSDGVTGYLEAADLATVLRAAADAQDAAQRVVRAAVARGGADNATAVVVVRRR
jgi:serine/threonine protein phosphatase PrpC